MTISKEDSFILPPRVPPVTVESIARNLSPDLQRVIGNIGPDLPSVFVDQAKETAGFVQLLDRNLGLTDPRIVTFVKQLERSLLVGNTLRRNPRLLPEWLQEDFLVKNGFREPPFTHKDEVLQDDLEYYDLYEEWLRSLGYPGTRDFIRLNPSLPDCPKPRICKAYIESYHLIRAHRDQKLSALVHNLEAVDYPLSATKQDSFSLVLYFNRDVADFAKANEVFENLGIVYRGPGQDQYRITLDTQGMRVTSGGFSNDQGLGGAFDSYVTYSPDKFLAQYLAVCQKVGKNPTKPYLTSFVDFDSRINLNSNQQKEATEKAAKMAGYPVLYGYTDPEARLRPKPLL